MFFQPLIICTTVIICFFSLLYNFFNNYDIHYYKKLLDKNKYYLNSYNFINYKKYLMNYSELLNIDITKELDDIDIQYIKKLLEIKFKLDKKYFIANFKIVEDSEQESDQESEKEYVNESDNESEKESVQESEKESEKESDNE